MTWYGQHDDGALRAMQDAVVDYRGTRVSGREVSMLTALAHLHDAGWKVVRVDPAPRAPSVHTDGGDAS